MKKKNRKNLLKKKFFKISWAVFTHDVFVFLGGEREWVVSSVSGENTKK